MDEGGVRNLDQIQETDRESKTPRAVTLTLLMVGGACAIFAGYILPGRKSAPVKAVDPLGDLVAQRSHAGAAAPMPTDLSPHDVTFPGMLSDGDKPTTALAAVRPNSLGSASATTGAMPPPAADRLSVMALPMQIPAQNVLEASPIVTRPRDPLTKAASDSAQMVTPATPSSGAGHEGGYQLQVSSFRSHDEADGFANQQRARGHKAYVLEAQVPGRGVWYRVRVGPFSTQHAASSYRSTFETREHVVPFIIPPAGKESQK
ncbi:MAG: SPOR domain-containing protein [Polyangiaceae bacterium]